MNRPKGLTATSVLMGICNAMGWAIVDWGQPHARLTFAIFTALILTGYIFVWFYWQGRNWARISVLLTCFLCFYNLLFITRSNVAGRIMIGSEAILAAFLVWWLNTAAVRSFFQNRASNSTP